MELKLQATPLDIKNELQYRYNNLVGSAKTRHEIVRPHMYWVTGYGEKKAILAMETSHLNNILRKVGFNADGSFECMYPSKQGNVKMTHHQDGVMTHEPPQKISCGTVTVVTPRDMVDFSLSEDDKKFMNICMTAEDYMSEDLLQGVDEIDFVGEIKSMM